VATITTINTNDSIYNYSISYDSRINDALNVCSIFIHYKLIKVKSFYTIYVDSYVMVTVFIP